MRTPPKIRTWVKMRCIWHTIWSDITLFMEIQLISDVFVLCYHAMLPLAPARLPKWWAKYQQTRQKSTKIDQTQGFWSFLLYFAVFQRFCWYLRHDIDYHTDANCTIIWYHNRYASTINGRSITHWRMTTWAYDTRILNTLFLDGGSMTPPLHNARF